MMMLMNFEVTPLLLPRQKALECYASHDAYDRSSCLFDAGRNFSVRA
jgi:hypothetical protein